VLTYSVILFLIMTWILIYFHFANVMDFYQLKLLFYCCLVIFFVFEFSACILCSEPGIIMASLQKRNLFKYLVLCIPFIYSVSY
jgi:hypothetical protein